MLQKCEDGNVHSVGSVYIKFESPTFSDIAELQLLPIFFLRGCLSLTPIWQVPHVLSTSGVAESKESVMISRIVGIVRWLLQGESFFFLSFF